MRIGVILTSEYNQFKQLLNFMRQSIKESELIEFDNFPEDLDNTTQLGIYGEKYKSINVEKVKLLKNLKALRIEGTSLTELPKELSLLPKLEFLGYKFHEVVVKSSSLSRLTNLKKLELSGQLNMVELLVAVGELVNLTHLKVYKTEITSLPDEIGRLAELKELNLEGNMLQNFPETIKKLGKLKKLNVDDNDFSIFPESITYLAQLENLSFRNNPLESLHTAIGNLLCLQVLDLSNNELKSLPESIGKLNNLKHFNISDNELKLLPESIGKLESLQSLDISDNNLTKLPYSFQNLMLLTELLLSSNILLEMPVQVANLKSVKDLNLNSNSIKNFPQKIDIGCLEMLTSLNLSENEIQDLPEAFGKLKRLYEIHLDGNKISKFPAVLLELAGLEVLSLNSNQLSTVPKEISKLQNLSELYLGSNSFTEFPVEVTGLRNLYKLSLEYNQIKEAPSHLSAMPALEDLCLAENLFEDFPIVFLAFLNLIRLDLSLNLIKYVPIEIFSFIQNDRIGICLDGNMISKKSSTKGLGYDELRILKTKLNIFQPTILNQEGDSVENVIKKHYSEDLHWNLKKLRAIKVSLYKPVLTSNITDKQMRQMWRRVLKYFIEDEYKSQDFESESSENSADLANGEINGSIDTMIDQITKSSNLQEMNERLEVKKHEHKNNVNTLNSLRSKTYSLGRKVSYQLRILSLDSKGITRKDIYDEGILYIKILFKNFLKIVQNGEAAEIDWAKLKILNLAESILYFSDWRQIEYLYGIKLLYNLIECGNVNATDPKDIRSFILSKVGLIKQFVFLQTDRRAWDDYTCPFKKILGLAKCNACEKKSKNDFKSEVQAESSDSEYSKDTLSVSGNFLVDFLEEFSVEKVVKEILVLINSQESLIKIARAEISQIRKLNRGAEDSSINKSKEAIEKEKSQILTDDTHGISDIKKFTKKELTEILLDMGILVGKS